MSWALSQGMHTTVKTFSILHLDVLVWFGYDLDEQTRVVENVRTFIGRIAHRALADMVRTRRTSELADM